MAEVPLSDRHDLFIHKLHQCAIVFDFNDPTTDVLGKQIKATTLAEMLEWITTQRGVITEQVYPEVVAMVSLVLSALSSIAHAVATVCRQFVSLDSAACKSYRRRLRSRRGRTSTRTRLAASPDRLRILSPFRRESRLQHQYR